MKTILFWVTFPITFPIYAVLGLGSWFFGLLSRVLEDLADMLDEWRVWCFKEQQQKKNEEIRAKLRREIHKNGREK